MGASKCTLIASSSFPPYIGNIKPSSNPSKQQLNPRIYPSGVGYYLFKSQHKSTVRAKIFAQLAQAETAISRSVAMVVTYSWEPTNITHCEFFKGFTKLAKGIIGDNNTYVSSS